MLFRTTDLSLDVILMGAYDRPRLAALVVGGVARVTLSSMTVPVLMSR